jgi:hemerythrin-like metal-binding protein
MEWSEDFESGLIDIDAHHRYIFAIIERARQLDNQADRAAIRNIVVDLGRLTRFHFDCEECLMVEYNYPDSAKHLAEHKKLLNEIHSYEDNAVFSTRQLALVLSNWLISHTIMEDRQLALHVLRHRNSSADMTLSGVVNRDAPFPPPASYIASRCPYRKVVRLRKHAASRT